MLKIVSSPDPVLSQPAKSITKIDSSILSLIEEMKVTLLHTKDPEGVGLAAPQVGKSLQIFITKPTPKSPFKIFINPFVTYPPIDDLEKTPSEDKKKEKKSTKLEGCLSLPDIWGEVQRHPKVIITYQDETGKFHKETHAGFMATILQHEYDHLRGILFPKHVLEQKGALYKSKKDEKGETVFEEIKL